VVVDDERFMDDWLSVKTEQQLKEVLLRDERFIHIKLRQGTNARELIGKTA